MQERDRKVQPLGEPTRHADGTWVQVPHSHAPEVSAPEKRVCVPAEQEPMAHTDRVGPCWVPWRREPAGHDSSLTPGGGKQFWVPWEKNWALVFLLGRKQAHDPSTPVPLKPGSPGQTPDCPLARNESLAQGYPHSVRGTKNLGNTGLSKIKRFLCYRTSQSL